MVISELYKAFCCFITDFTIAKIIFSMNCLPSNCRKYECHLYTLKIKSNYNTATNSAWR